MEYQRFGNMIYARIDRGEEVQDALRRLCLAENVRLGTVSALGATDDFTVGVFDVETKVYHSLNFSGTHEIVSLTGTVSTMNGEYYAHLHMSAANGEGQVRGGHLNRARISATCELVLTVTDGVVERQKDESVGLNLFRFEDGEKA